MALSLSIAWVMMCALHVASMRQSMARTEILDWVKSDGYPVHEECAGYGFSRAEEPFATGHNGAVKVYMAEGAEGRRLVWKKDRRAGPSGECSLLNRLGNSGMRGLGCAANCREGLLSDAVIDLHTGEPAPSFESQATMWVKQGIAIKPKVEILLPQFLQELEKMMMAGVLNLDQKAQNVLIQTQDLKITLIDFGVFEHTTQDFGDWSSIPDSYKVAMFGPVSVGIAFCGQGLPYSICQAAQDVASELLAHNLGAVHFQKDESKQLAAEGLGFFAKKGGCDYESMFDIMRRQPVDASLTKVKYSAGWDEAPSTELALIRKDGDLVVEDVSGSKAPLAGVRAGMRLVKWASSGVTHEVTESTAISDLDVAHQTDSVDAIFDFGDK